MKIASMILVVIIVFSTNCVFADNAENNVNRSTGWKQIKCDNHYSKFTIEELKNMAESSGNFNARRGSMFERKVTGGAIEKHDRIINVQTVVRILDQAPDNLSKIVGSYIRVGDYDFPMDEVLSKTLLQAAEETGSTEFMVFFDEVNDEFKSNLFFTTSSYTKHAYVIKVLAFWNVGIQPDVCK